ncbi:MAG: hypothetical protein QW255_05315 [Candidatus Bilamarchaeaceae archaeon]
MKKTNLNYVLFSMQNEVTFKFFVDNKMRSQYTRDNNYPQKESLQESLDNSKTQESTDKKYKRFMINKE